MPMGDPIGARGMCFFKLQLVDERLRLIFGCLFSSVTVQDLNALSDIEDIEEYPLVRLNW